MLKIHPLSVRRKDRGFLEWHGRPKVTGALAYFCSPVCLHPLPSCLPSSNIDIGRYNISVVPSKWYSQDSVLHHFSWLSLSWFPMARTIWFPLAWLSLPQPSRLCSGLVSSLQGPPLTQLGYALSADDHLEDTSL